MKGGVYRMLTVKHCLLSDAGFICRHLIFCKLVQMFRKEFLDIGFLVVGFLPEHQVRQDAYTAVALQRPFADLKHHAEVLVVVEPLAVMPFFVIRIFFHLRHHPLVVPDFFEELFLPVKHLHDGAKLSFYSLYVHALRIL